MAQSVYEMFTRLKELGRVTVTSETYSPEANARLDRWNVMVSMYGTGRIVQKSHSDLYWAAQQLLEKIDGED